ncbi:lantibiotic dehydratase [Nocardioides sp. 1609]|uniref:lantibiotic dehydratase n=1 Tax=Nocardioides sp. 1609 TaxID=2508327 RepID=UPI0010704CBC|nr:lantibiotic dehydratase [Nocardioides sp. 1609]
MTATYDADVATRALLRRTLRPGLAPMALARIGGLPVDVLHALRDEVATAWATSVLALEMSVSALATGLSDALHPLVGDNADQEQRRFLVNLRRRVFRGQPLADPAADIALVAGLHAGTGRLLEQWHLAERALVARVAAGPGIVDADVAASRVALQQLADRPELRAGVLVASPPLSNQLGGFLRMPPEKVDKKRRKLERSVLSYVGRTVVKPSPFGTFTPVQVATFGADGAGTDGYPIDSATRSRVRLNVAVLNRICRLVLDDADKRADLPVAATAGWVHDDDRIRYVRRWIEGGEEQQAVTFDAVTDKLFFLRNGEALDELLDLLGGADPAPTFATVAAWLAVRHDADLEASESYLAALLRLGLVEVPGLQVPVHAADPVAALAEVLRTLVTLGPGGTADPVAWAVAIGDRLDDVRARLADYAEADVAGRAVVLSEVRAIIAEVFATLGDDSPDAVPQTLVYEDCVAGPDPIVLDEESWDRDVLEPLRAVDPLLRAWDVTLAQRLTFQAYFVARFGVGGRAEDLLELLHDFSEDFFEQYQTMSGQRKAYGDDGSYQPEINWLRSEDVDRLDTARVALTEALRDAYTGQELAEEVVITPEVVATVAEHTGRLPFGDEPRSHLVQLVPQPGGSPRVVLNQGYGGLHFPFSRFAYAFDGTDGTADLTTGLRERARDAAADGVVHAEITGGPVTSNLNLHDRLTDHEIVCPGEQSSVPTEQQIHLDDLYAVHLPDEGRVALRSRRLDVEVVPTYLGYLIPLALPEIPRSMLLFAQTSMSQFDPWGGLPAAPVDDGVGYRPRVSCGNVVLRRRCWAVGAADLPVGAHVAAPTDDATRLLTWQRWRATHRMPRQVFVKTQVASGFRGAGSSKPMYVDFGSVLSLQALEGVLEQEALVLFTEMLPDLDAAPGRSADGRHVVELAIEHQPRPTSEKHAQPERTTS